MRRDVFQAIADPTRRDIIQLLAGKPQNLNSIADNFDISRPAISKHIKILTECGLVIIQAEGRERYCHVSLGGLRQVAEWTNQYREFWNEKLDALGDFLAEEKKNKRKK
ncbi:helix-turn-helix transcriptional regulator [Chitinophaga sp. Cy-1792]|uniref:ArsR/SmtB family transcription factor n=1 Tax=Chitinophaga sp. Cy-1792 TaxID=2608339 RepID=UPI00141F57A3|nr:metalloregulator ArsR/SmtB family transcription factor [Chitinophaga sp. Cy-1792]NIG56460.1 winged helix-turn-helix transcriptional regulator [Chitinophaga sp. Cy-1792]